MIYGIGIDSVDIKRFNHWNTYSEVQLKRIFSSQELAYCLKEESKKLERLAVRFAAKEAFYKAWSSYAPECTLSFMNLCTKVHVAHHAHGAPYLIVDWNILFKNSKHASTPIRAHLSLTHTKSTATALVVLEGDEKEDNSNPFSEHSSHIVSDNVYDDSLYEEDEDQEEEEEEAELIQEIYFVKPKGANNAYTRH